MYVRFDPEALAALNGDLACALERKSWSIATEASHESRRETVYRHPPAQPERRPRHSRAHTRRMTLLGLRESCTNTTDGAASLELVASDPDKVKSDEQS